MKREKLLEHAREVASEAVSPHRWHFWGDGWRRGETQAVEGRCPDCGEDLGDDRLWPRDGFRCECERTAYNGALETFLGEHRHKAVPTEWSRANFPPRYAAARFENFKDREGAEAARARCEGWATAFEPRKTDRGLFLVGGFGTGKSHLLAATSYRVLERTLVRPRFVSAAGLLAAVKGGESVDMRPVRDAIAAELLVLDDLGQVGRTEFDRELMYSIVSERYDHRRPMLVTSNLPADRLGDILGGALSSRLYEACDTLVLTASDYRKELARKAS